MTALSPRHASCRLFWRRTHAHESITELRMITVRRSRDRLRGTHGTGDRWQTFDPAAPMVAGLEGLAHFDEERVIPEGFLEDGDDTVVEDVLYVCDGRLAFDRGAIEIELTSGTFVRILAKQLDRRAFRNPSQTRGARAFSIGLQRRLPALMADVGWIWSSVTDRTDALRVVASSDGRGGSLRLGQQATVYSAVLNPGRHVVHEIHAGHAVWLHIVEGGGDLGSVALAAGDGAGLVDERAISFTPRQATELLVVDLPR